jgi:hypothetical protein
LLQVVGSLQEAGGALKKRNLRRERERQYQALNIASTGIEGTFQSLCASLKAPAAVSPTTPYGAFASAAEGMRIVQVFGKINF